MVRGAQKRKRKARVSAICCALPRVRVRSGHDCLAFEAGPRVFAYYLDDHHGDGITSVCCKVLPGDQEFLIAANPRKFYLPAYIGPRGWVGLRLDRRTVDWNEVDALVQASYQLAGRARRGRTLADDAADSGP